MAPMRWRWRGATARRRSSPASQPSEAFRTRASRRALATISRSTSASTVATWSEPSTHSSTGASDGSTSPRSTAAPSSTTCRSECTGRPARPGHPRDKAKVEVGVLIAQRWILARLRHETFFSLDALNERIGELLEELNDRRMRVYGASRRELFERLDHPALKRLPVEPFAYSEWRKARLNIDYHADVEHHFYSAPHALVHEELEARLTAITVELFHKGERVASHLRSYQRGRHTTIDEHMPKAHREHAEWSPSRIISWAETIGASTRALAEAILAERRHLEQGYRSCLGILRLGKQYGKERLEAACARAFSVRARSYRHVESILKNNLDRIPLPAKAPAAGPPVDHENIRGGDYYN